MDVAWHRRGEAISIGKWLVAESRQAAKWNYENYCAAIAERDESRTKHQALRAQIAEKFGI